MSHVRTSRTRSVSGQVPNTANADLQKAIQKYQKGEKVSMSVTEGGVKRRKDFTVDSAEHSEVDNKWIYSLKTKDGVWKGGQFFREADLTFTR